MRWGFGEGKKNKALFKKKKKNLLSKDKECFKLKRFKRFIIVN